MSDCSNTIRIKDDIVKRNFLQLDITAKLKAKPNEIKIVHVEFLYLQYLPSVSDCVADGKIWYNILCVGITPSCWLFVLTPVC